MSTYYYLACHDCRRYVPLVSVAASGTVVHNRLNPRAIVDHTGHSVEVFSEHDLDARPFDEYTGEAL